MECEICGFGPPLVTLFRMNPKGEKGIWRCRECGGEPKDEIIESIVDIIEKV